MTTVTYGREASRHGLRFIPDSLARLAGRVNRYLARSRVERQLDQLDDRLLMDIGVKRSDIHRMVWGN
jgi:uncharacterized protein YjiS (DUF1127 family)